MTGPGTGPAPAVFVAFRLPPELAGLRDGRFELSGCDGAPPPDDPALRQAVRALVTNGIRGADRALIEAFPNLELIASLGIGLDALDLGAAKARGVIVTNTPGVVADDVADLALMMIVDRLRRVSVATRYVHEGRWSSAPFPLARSVTGKVIGILGMGAIGRAVARRSDAFRARVKWYGPRAKPDVAWEYVPDLLQLARESDVLVVACSGGTATRHLVDARVLEALGPDGILVNVARGSIVDTDALVAAVQAGRIAGAALDVFEGQPQVPAALLSLDNVLLTPHLGTATRETRARMGRMVQENLVDHFEGREPRYRVV